MLGSGVQNVVIHPAYSQIPESSEFLMGLRELNETSSCTLGRLMVNFSQGKNCIEILQTYASKILFNLFVLCKEQLTIGSLKWFIYS